jgi:CBS-domain-containing membrane protein
MYSLLMNQVKPSERSGASAMNALVIASSQAIAAVVAGAALARFGYTVVLQGVALTALVAALTFRILLSKAVPSSARSAAVLRPATESSSAID